MYTYAAAAAAAKSLQSCPTLCDPIDGSPAGSPVPGILQARTLEWVAISFSSAWKWKVKVKTFSRVQLLATPWTAAHQAPPSMDFPGKRTGVGCHCLRLSLFAVHLKLSQHCSLTYKIEGFFFPLKKNIRVDVVICISLFDLEDLCLDVPLCLFQNHLGFDRYVLQLFLKRHAVITELPAQVRLGGVCKWLLLTTMLASPLKVVFVFC